MSVDPKSLALTAARAADSKGGTEILVIDVGDVLAICDYFVVVTAANSPQVKAIVDHIEERTGEELDDKPRAIEGAGGRHWVLMDYGSVVVHVFLAEDRDYYRIERLYSDSPKVDWAEADQTVDRIAADRIDADQAYGARQAD
ncbi:MAG TPA: ribosome silencing factor [Microthrixaceae bacterium]|nr:ribosome silencing factor [Microthrixaceae bacterium]